MHLAFVFRKRQTRRLIGQPPLPSLIIYRQAKEFDKRWPCSALGSIFGVGISLINPSEVDLSECGNADKQHQPQKQWNDGSDSTRVTHETPPKYLQNLIKASPLPSRPKHPK